MAREIPLALLGRGFQAIFAIVASADYHALMNTTSESLLFRLQHTNDGQLDQSAWEEFVRLYTPLMFYWARKTGLNTADASDLVQDVVTRVFQKLPDFCYDASRSFRSWLRTITLNRYREIKRRKSSGMELATDSMLEQLAPIEAAESAWDVDYARLLVARAMEQMESNFAPTTWGALRRVMSDGKTVDEAAAETGVSPWTIYSARSKLMKQLRSELEGLL